MQEIMKKVPENPQPDVLIGLGAILVLVLVLPFISKKVEENLEPFFLAMGLIGIAVNYVTGILREHDLILAIFRTAAKTPVSIAGLPIGITQVVLIAGLVFYYYNKRLKDIVNGLVEKYGLPAFALAVTFVVGMAASIISVIVSAVILAEIAAILKIDRRSKLEFVVIASFSLGLGAALTPVGEPLSTIAVSKLGETFDYLLRLLGAYIVPAIIVLSLYAWYRMKNAEIVSEEGVVHVESLRNVVYRAVKVYMFVAALELLGASLIPLTVWYFSKMESWMLYWVNTISAVVDNATLTAAEISPLMTPEQIRSALMSLLISGGMLIPGNIPNIVAAGRLRISMKEWARIGVPIGVVLLLVYFAILHVFGLHIGF
jgi:predicted cation transporter